MFFVRNIGVVSHFIWFALLYDWNAGIHFIRHALRDGLTKIHDVQTVEKTGKDTLALRMKYLVGL